MATAVRVEYVPGGDALNYAALARMREIVNMAITQPAVVAMSHRVIADVPPRDDVGKALAIRDWMVAHFAFVADPVGVELLRTPDYLLREWARTGRVSGDCDDAAILSATFAKAVGLSCRFVALGFRANRPFAHVYTLAITRTQRVQFDVTKPMQRVPRAVRRSETAV